MKQPAKKARGQPKKANPKSERINWRVTPDKKARYEKAARKAGKGLTPWLEAVADDASG